MTRDVSVPGLRRLAARDQMQSICNVLTPDAKLQTNALRNMALLAARTELIFVGDGDMLAGSGLRAAFGSDKSCVFRASVTFCSGVQR